MVRFHRHQPTGLSSEIPALFYTGAYTPSCNVIRRESLAHSIYTLMTDAWARFDIINASCINSGRDTFDAILYLGYEFRSTHLYMSCVYNNYTYVSSMLDSGVRMPTWQLADSIHFSLRRGHIKTAAKLFIASPKNGLRSLLKTSTFAICLSIFTVTYTLAAWYIINNKQ